MDFPDQKCRTKKIHISSNDTDLKNLKDLKDHKDLKDLKDLKDIKDLNDLKYLKDANNRQGEYFPDQWNLQVTHLK